MSQNYSPIQLINIWCQIYTECNCLLREKEEYNLTENKFWHICGHINFILRSFRIWNIQLNIRVKNSLKKIKLIDICCQINIVIFHTLMTFMQVSFSMNFNHKNDVVYRNERKTKIKSYLKNFFVSFVIFVVT